MPSSRVHLSRRTLLAAVPAASLLALAGCSKEPEASAGAFAPAAPAGKRTPSLEIVAAEGKGFTVGSMMAANPVYVFFDPQCPHCGHLWEASIPLQRKLKFVWMPVSLLNASSGPQGATILSAKDPAATMAEHEKSLLARNGGVSAASSIPDDATAAVKTNTALFNAFSLESVPYIFAHNVRTNQTVMRGGSMTTEQLAELVGVEP